MCKYCFSVIFGRISHNGSYTKFIQGIIAIPENKNIVVVTTDYYMFRSLGVARKQGYQNVSGLASRSQITVLPIYLFREYFAIVFYALTGRFKKSFYH